MTNSKTLYPLLLSKEKSLETRWASFEQWRKKERQKSYAYPIWRLGLRRQKMRSKCNCKKIRFCKKWGQGAKCLKDSLFCNNDVHPLLLNFELKSWKGILWSFTMHLKSCQGQKFRQFLAYQTVRQKAVLWQFCPIVFTDFFMNVN